MGLTIELRYFENHKNLFDFEYNFYNEEQKYAFEEQFFNHYFFHEIGFESKDRFKQRLKSILNLKNNYYQQLYNTELESQGITFLLNKDLTETYERDLKSNNLNTYTSNSNSNSDSNSNSNSKESSSSDGTASVTLEQGYLSNVNNNTDTTKSNSKNDTKGENKGNTDMREITKLVSKGNIGTTSSAELLSKWREVLINMNEIIIKDLRVLFLNLCG